MEVISSVLSALLFIAFVPGVLFQFPERGSKMKILAIHTLLFVVVTHFVMLFYWTKVRNFVEKMTNYGQSCPNGYVEGVSQKGEKDCVPAGHATYATRA